MSTTSRRMGETEMLNRARTWLLEGPWSHLNFPGGQAGIGWIEITHALDAHYPGGWQQFQEDVQA